MKKYKRIFTIVIDSLGVGEGPDAANYGDLGTDTLGHIDSTRDSFVIPNLQKLGMANLHPLNNVPAVETPMGYYRKMQELSAGKDTMTGHWELMGLEVKTPFQTYSENGFPKDLIDELEKRFGRKIIGNKSCSGTEILKELADQEINEGKVIVYTSADSVLQICGDEDTMGLDTLYHYCEIARELTLQDKWKVGRIIARPYVVKGPGEYVRTPNRHDYALAPIGRTVLDSMKDAGYEVISVGKIFDIFDGHGLTESNKSQSSVHGMQQTNEIADRDFTGMCFTNLVDFDALWGHRRNPQGYGDELERFDVLLGELLGKLKEDDLLCITADHGNDPIHTGTDHTREYVPLLLYSPGMKGNGLLPAGKTFADLGATIADNFEVEAPLIGESVLDLLK